MTSITSQDLIDAGADLKTLSDVANGSTTAVVTSRLGGSIRSVAHAIADMTAFIPRGSWATNANYSMKDLVNEAGIVYVAVATHTSAATFAADLAAGKWAIYQHETGIIPNLIGNGITDDRDAIAAYDSALSSGYGINLPDGTYRIASNLTIAHFVTFAPGAVLKPDPGVTVTLSGGFSAPTMSHIFDITDGDVWVTGEGRVTQWHYGAVGNLITDDVNAFQHMVDCQVYFQLKDEVHPAPGQHYWSKSCIVGYGSDFRGLSWIGPGARYQGSNQFGGLYIKTDSIGCALEFQGARATRITGTTFHGPFIDWFYATYLGNGATIPIVYPDLMSSWLPTGMNPLALSRYKMSSGVHIDPRCGAKPTAAAWAGNTSYSFGTSTKNGGHLYVCYNPPENPGTSAESGGPAGTGSSPITDGTCIWMYAGADTVSIAYDDITYPGWTSIVTQYGKDLSSGIELEGVEIQGFGCGVAVKGCNADGNADFVTLKKCQINLNVFSMSWGQTQGRLNGVSDCIFGESYAQFSVNVIGKQQGNGHLHAVNSQLGNSHDVIIGFGSNGGIHIDGCFGEGMRRIGTNKSGGPAGDPFKISACDFGFDHIMWWRVPENIIDCDGNGVTIDAHTLFNYMSCPLVIKCDPTLCHIEAEMPNPQWMGSPTPATITVGQAIMRRSTCDVIFQNSNQGPWTGKIRRAWEFNVATGVGRATIPAGTHARSDVTNPIPFCAQTATGSYRDGPPIPVALGGYQGQLGAASFVSLTQVGRVMTLTMTGAPSLSNAQNLGYVAGSIMSFYPSNNIFVIESLIGAIITATQLNDWDCTTEDAINPTLLAGQNFYFVPCGHYLPDISYALGYTASANTPTYLSASGGNGDAIQIPVGAVKVVSDQGDAMTPILRANSAVIASGGTGTIQFAGNARLTATERTGLFLIPRP